MSDIEQKLREQAKITAEELGVPTERTYLWQTADYIAKLKLRLARAEMHIQPGPAWDEYQEEVKALTEAKAQPAPADEREIERLQKKHRTEFIAPMGWAGVRTPLESCALICEEIGELTHELRQETWDNTKVGYELADIVLRVMDLAEDCGVNLSQAVRDKMAKNIRTMDEKKAQGRRV